MYISFSIPAAFASILWVLVEGYLAHRNGMLTPAQMSAKSPGRRGLPFIAHGGMWGDVIIISPLVGLIVGTHGGDWTLVQIVIMFAIAMVLSGVMHWTYVQTPFPDSLAWKDEGITAAGWLHLIYMGAAFAVIGLLYFCTPSPSPVVVSLTGFLLSIHVVIGTHVLLGVLNELEPIEWCPNVLAPPTGYVVIGTWSVIIAMTIFAMGVSSEFILLLAATLALWLVTVLALWQTLERFPFFLGRLF